MPAALLIHNPNAGRFPSADSAHQAAAVLEQAGWTVRIRESQSAGHVTDLAAEAAALGLDALIVAGGDGTLGRAVSGLLGSSTALGVLPTGTANVWARELGLPQITPFRPESAVENARLLAASRVHGIDVGICNGSPFLLWAGFGLDALVVRQAEQKRSRIKKLFIYPEYMLRIVQISAGWPGMALSVSGWSGDRNSPASFEGRVQIAIVSNIRLYAGGLATLSPAARLDDGEMDLWLFRGRGAGGVVRSAWNLLRGKHVQDTRASRITFNRLVVETEAPVPVHTDGEPRAESRRIDVEVRPGALNILLPSTAPEWMTQQRT